ncbi:MAG: hypothetical protein RR988_03285 [Clostridia bacterium]
MKNVKMKKTAAAILAATLVAGTAGVLINKSDASFKFVAEEQGTYEAANFTAEICAVDALGNQIGTPISLGSTTTGGAVKLPVNLSADNLIPGNSVTKCFEITNTGSVNQNVELTSKLEPTDPSNNACVELAKRMTIENNLGSVVLEPGDTVSVTVLVNFPNGTDVVNNQGSDNAASSGSVNAYLNLQIKDR